MGKAVYKAKGGIISVAIETSDVIQKIKITGDFFIFPEDSIVGLEKAIMGVKIEGDELQKVINDFYKNIDAYGIEPEEMVKAIKRAM